MRAAAGEAERRRLNETFAALCRIDSPSGRERACAEWVTGALRALGLEVHEDGAADAVGADCGNLLTRIPAHPGLTDEGRSSPPPPPTSAASGLLLCSHLDTVPTCGAVEPVIVEDGWENARDDILGADNKAAVAVMLELARHLVKRGAPLEVELLFTVSEEVSLAGAREFDATQLRSRLGYVFDHASPIGEVVLASPTHYRLDARLRGAAAHAGIRPEDGRSAIVAAAHAIASMRLGRLDEQTTANIGTIEGGTALNVVPEHVQLVGEARSLDARRAEAAVAEMVDRLQDAANLPVCECDLDLDVARLFEGYRTPPSDPAIVAADAALRACGYQPRHIVTGGGSDANALQSHGFRCANLANGTERNHQPDERVSVAALEGMLDVALALVDEVAQGPLE